VRSSQYGCLGYGQEYFGGRFSRNAFEDVAGFFVPMSRARSAQWRLATQLRRAAEHDLSSAAAVRCAPERCVR